MLLLFVFSVSASETVYVVCSCDVKTSPLTVRQVSDIFLGRKRTLNDGERIRLAVLNSGPVHAKFVSGCTGKSEQQFRRHWRNMVFSGRGIMPKAFSSEKDLVAYIASNDGVIGYVTDTNLTARADINVICMIKETDE